MPGPITEFTGTPPALNQTQPDFDQNTQDFIDYMANLAPELNAYAAALNTLSTNSSSTSSVSIGTGTKNFTIETGKSLFVGMSYKMANDANNWMLGDIISYNSGTGALSIDVDTVRGSGTYAAWVGTLSFNGQISASQLAPTIFNDLSTVTPTVSDSLPLADADDSGNKKKATISSLLALAPGRLVNTIIYTVVSQALTSISNGSPAVCTVSSAANLPQNGSPLRFTTTGSLPTGLSTGTTYWVINASGTTFNVSATKGGVAINTSSAGSGTHSIANAPYEKATNNPTFIEVEVQAGGGGGGGTAVAAAAGAGGGAGGYSFRTILNAALASSETVTVGSGGAGGTAAPGAGGNGNSSSFGSLATATGGNGGEAGASGATKRGGAGGVGSSGDLNLAGDPGVNSVGGAGATTSAGGNGGSSKFAGAGRAASGALGAGEAAALASGAGGGGGSGGSALGGAGGYGIVIVREYA